MKTVAFILGIIAVVFYLLGYLQKKRKNIIFYNIISRILFIGQYLLLKAFEGAILDVAAIIPSLIAPKKEIPFIKKHLALFIVGGNLFIIILGLLVYEDVFSILPIIGVMLHTSALWITDEKIIRRVLLLGCPFCFVYNLVRGAYGSCMGDVFSSISLIIAMLRYDYRIFEKHSRKENTCAAGSVAAKKKTEK